jgi:hypothetical protein
MAKAQPQFSINDLLGLIAPSNVVPAVKSGAKKVKKGAEQVGSLAKDQLLGAEAEKYLNQIFNPTQDFSQAGKGQNKVMAMSGLDVINNPYTMRGMDITNNLFNGVTSSGLGQWFGLDAIRNIMGANPNGQAGNAGDFANALFSLAPLGGAKVAKGAVKGAKKAGAAGAKVAGGMVPNDIKNFLRMWLDSQEG